MGLKVNLGKATMTIIMLSIILYPLKTINPLTVNPFIHANITHLTYNMIALFLLGNALEIHTSTKLIITLLITSTIITWITMIVFYPGIQVIGISGLIYAVIGSLIVIKPKLTILMPLGLISVPAPAWIAGPVMGLIELVMSKANDGVAHSAHINSLIIGVIIGLTWLNNKHNEQVNKQAIN